MIRIKVVHIVEAFAGGIYTYFRDLADFFGSEQISKEIETTIIYSGKRKEIIPENIKKEFPKNIRIIEVDMVREISPFKDLCSSLRLRKHLKELSPDIIHLHSSKSGILGRFANFLLLFNKKKVFYTPQGYSFLREDVSLYTRKIYKLFEKYSQCLLGGTTIACGDTEYEIAQKMGKSLLVRNGINLTKLEKHYKEHKNQKLTIGIVGRITYQKNPVLFNEIALRFPQYDFVWIGDGEQKKLLTAKNIRITGWLSDQDTIFKKLNQLDVYLQTSLWEGLPLAILEAMAFRKPIVATNVIGNKDTVVHKENGFIFNEKEELDEFFKQIESEAIRLKMGENSYQRCKKDFNAKINFAKLLKIYKYSVSI